MDKIFENGSTTYNALTSLPSISAECWGSMLHGVEPEVHKLTNSIVGSERYDINSEYPSFFRVIRENYPDANLASFCNWDPINYGIIEENLNVHMEHDDDEPLTDKIIDYINKNDFVQFSFSLTVLTVQVIATAMVHQTTLHKLLLLTRASAKFIIH